MALAVARLDRHASAHVAALPSNLKVLFVASGPGAATWLAEAFAADGAHQIAVEEAIGATAGMARLRDEAFDGVFHLASAVSGECEADFELGLASNLDSTRALLDALRHRAEQGATPTTRCPRRRPATARTS